MSPILIALIVIVLIVLVLVFIVIGIYNSLVRLKNEYINGFSQIDVQLQRRYDLIPNLVTTAKGYMEHEKGTLEAVIQARNEALASKNKLAQNPSDTNAAQNFAKSEGALNGMMTKFMALSESYPDLKANTNMQTLMEELSSTENKVSFSRQAYNDSVMSYNVGREQFPAVILAGMFGFNHVAQLDIEDVAARKAIKVEF